MKKLSVAFILQVSRVPRIEGDKKHQILFDFINKRGNNNKECSLNIRHILNQICIQLQAKHR